MAAKHPAVPHAGQRKVERILGFCTAIIKGRRSKIDHGTQSNPASRRLLTGQDFRTSTRKQKIIPSNNEATSRDEISVKAGWRLRSPAFKVLVRLVSFI